MALTAISSSSHFTEIFLTLSRSRAYRPDLPVEGMAPRSFRAYIKERSLLGNVICM